MRGWMLAVMLCCAAGAASGEEPLDARLRDARAAFDEAGTLWDAGRYEDAIARGEHALALREAVLGGTHPEVASSLELLGSHHLRRGNPVRAEPLLQRALAIREAALGTSHPEVAQTLTMLARLYSAQWQMARAEPLHARALTIREAALGKHHLLVAESLNHLANLYMAQELYARAEPLYVRALTIREATLVGPHLDVAQTLHDFAGFYHQQGAYGRAEPLYIRAVAIREVALGKNHPLVAESLQWLAALYQQQGLHARARPHHERALAIQEAALADGPPDVADSLTRLAGHYLMWGLFSRAEPLDARALAIREERLGESHLLVAVSLHNLAALHQEQGLYGKAEPLYERALAIFEAAFGRDHPDVTDTLMCLVRLYEVQGLYARAEPLLARALAIREAAYGENHPYVAGSLSTLARLYVAQGAYERAEALYTRARSILETVLGGRHPSVASLLNNLAHLYQAQGLYHRAEPLHARALALLEASLGKDHSRVALSLNHLAGLYSAQGLYSRARPLQERALAILEARLDSNHPSVAATLNQIAVAHLAQQRFAHALPLLSRAFTLSEQRLRQETLGFSEARLAGFLQSLRSDEERLYALLRAHPEDARVRRLALGAALLLKGRSGEESAVISRTVFQSLGDEDQDTFEQLRGLRTQLAQLSLQGADSLHPRDYRQRLDALSAQAADLETRLARRSSPLRALVALPSTGEIVDRVAQALPRDSALVELIAYEDRPLVPGPGARGAQPRYLALVLLPDGTIRLRDLGPAEPIDSAASRLRDALANRDSTFEAPSQALYQLAFQPLLPLLGNTRRLFLSPDGQLALVPFAVLHDGQRFLVDTFDFTYVPSGRSLLPRTHEDASPDSVVVLADPDFTASKAGASTLATRELPGGDIVSTLRAHLAARAWAPTPLPGTREEAQAIQRLLPQAQLFLGAQATRQRLMQLPAPGILHLATHGFFVEDTPVSPSSRAVAHFGALGEDAWVSRLRDPLLRSGLVLAGAGASAFDTSLVTALELTGLNLWGTQLVVLSACDTGRGDVKLGQGVYGLRRAFLVAGAETVVMSLWKVDDGTTSELMAAYYRHLLAGQGRAAALRAAMRELRQREPHPHHWAPFIAMGRDAPLRLPAVNR